ncbi:MAG: DUF805 domain-containing protein [Clostridiales bacterium]|jgi:uncharacterized membrane protein YhaH (DUF805 family)|nr:DUF805 domain-containing protein [Clostridiales bacterium]
MKGYWDSYLSVFKKDYANFGGREGKKRFVVFILFTLAISFILGALAGLFSGIDVVAWIFGALGTIFWLITIIPFIAIVIRRLRAVGWTVWLALLLILVIPGIVLIILLALKD